MRWSRSSRAALGIAAGCLLSTAALTACGPFFADWILDNDSRLFEAPVSWFSHEVGRILGSPDPTLEAVPEAFEPQTAAVDADEVAAFVGAESAPAVAYRQVREALLAYQQARWEWEDTYPQWRTGPEPVLPELAVPRGLPREVSLYLDGALLYHRGDLAAARSRWEALLALPEGDRRHRSTWAAYMLGRAEHRLGEAEKAVARYEETRTLARSGFADSLGLAVASLGWQAQIGYDRGRPAEAAELYLRQLEQGEDSGARTSLRWCARDIMASPEQLRQAVRSPRLLRVLVAHVLSSWQRNDWDGPLDSAEAQTLLAAVRDAGLTEVEDADRMAVVAYRAGDFAAADAWARRAPADASAALWIRGKLLLREGKLAEAEKLLAAVDRPLPADALDPNDPDDSGLRWTAYEQQAPLAGKPRLLGELGTIRLANGRYAEALDALARGGYWEDASWVAERVLTVAELKKTVDAHWSAEVAPSLDAEREDFWAADEAGLASPSVPHLAYQLRYLLGRRLMRAGRIEEAVSYLPSPHDAQARELARALKAKDLFAAACITRHHGLELYGSELEPDWTAYGGQLERERFLDSRKDPERHTKVAPSVDEVARAQRHAVVPDQRWHYRYRAADLAWQAAAELPDGSEDKARVLAVAGTWLKGKDPEAADRFYKALVRCCRNTELGRAADELRWFPDVEGCGPE